MQDSMYLSALQVAAVLVYIFCGIFGTSFVVNFVVIVLLLTLDFWTVRIGPSAACRQAASLCVCHKKVDAADQEHIWATIGRPPMVE